MILLQVSAAWTVVVVIGGATSANDISREIAEVAKGVHISSRSALSESTPKKLHGYENLWLHSMIEVVGTDDGVRFQDGSKVYADIILHCTGYKYHFPFLETNGIVTVDENRVGPLYKDIFPPAFALSLSFVGLLWKLDYEDWLAAECGSPPPEEWRKQMYFITGERRKTRPESYRDQWDDGDLIIQAHQDFIQYIPELAQVQSCPDDVYGICGKYYS
ncbi:hypothetical protein T459_17060 [Capsicum annuum]|uniref:Flavin-containing monooxygenase n=1 Tax=Capsicum annuum TaxID=4072 RepID=A0A2G2ZAI2_CAPAN|nr:hypothetical protein T459_17060 [Capsicum annuum]